MAYVNFDIAKTKGLNPFDIITLQIIRQLKREPEREEDLVNVLTDEFLEKTTEKGWVETIKGKKKDSEISKLRLTKSGNRLMDDLETPEVNEEDILLGEWLREVYKKEGREVGNFKKTKMYIALFRVNSGIEKNKLAYLCKSFMEDEKSFEYSRKLEYLFWKPSHMYNTKFDINDSKLYQFYLKNKEQYDAKFEKL